jgi:SAM-dependent methyltransferase
VSLLDKLFRGSGARTEPTYSPEALRVTRRSNGLSELMRTLGREEGLRVLDLGCTSPQNINYFAGMGFRIYSEDVLTASQDQSLQTQDAAGQAALDVNRFLTENLVYEPEFFDAVLCWDTPDYLHSDLVKPVIQRIHRVMRPRGLLLSFFHTRDAGPDAPYHRYHVAAQDTLALQLIPAAIAGHKPSIYSHFRLQRVFNNRHIENLFHDFSSIKFFLGRDNIREVLVVR